MQLWINVHKKFLCLIMKFKKFLQYQLRFWLTYLKGTTAIIGYYELYGVRKNTNGDNEIMLLKSFGDNAKWADDKYAKEIYVEIHKNIFPYPLNQYN